MIIVFATQTEAAAVASAAGAASIGGTGAAADAQAAAAEADLANHAGDVGEWLGVDGGASLVNVGLELRVLGLVLRRRLILDLELGMCCRSPLSVHARQGCLLVEA